VHEQISSAGHERGKVAHLCDLKKGARVCRPGSTGEEAAWPI